eukprot:1158825-Pelagomonas_calceolata.AAC.1
MHAWLRLPQISSCKVARLQDFISFHDGKRRARPHSIRVARMREKIGLPARSEGASNIWLHSMGPGHLWILASLPLVKCAGSIL